MRISAMILSGLIVVVVVVVVEMMMVLSVKGKEGVVAIHTHKTPHRTAAVHNRAHQHSTELRLRDCHTQHQGRHLTTETPADIAVVVLARSSCDVVAVVLAAHALINTHAHSAAYLWTIGARFTLVVASAAVIAKCTIVCSQGGREGKWRVRVRGSGCLSFRSIVSI